MINMHNLEGTILYICLWFILSMFDVLEYDLCIMTCSKNRSYCQNNITRA
jgi:hypothetical protein